MMEQSKRQKLRTAGFSGQTFTNADFELQIQERSPSTLKPNKRNARAHSKKQIRQIADSIQAFGFNNPILVDEDANVLAGHGRLEAAILLGMETVPVVCISHLKEAQKRAYILADNQIARNAGWDSELLAGELKDLETLLPELELDLEIIGFETAEIDILLEDFEDPVSSEQDEDDVLPDIENVPVARRGDVWQLGRHKVLCGDARDQDGFTKLLKGRLVDLVITDPPYNVRVQGHVGGRGKTKHSEFAFASGEMSDAEFQKFLQDSLEIMMQQTEPGCLFYVFMDWRHIEVLLSIGRKLGLALKNICVWNKTNAGQGSFYRSAHELIAVFAKPGGASTNNIQLGKFGRNRSNVWTFPGANTFRLSRADPFALHPTVKPMAMIVEVIKDASKRNQIVLDPFLGSGTTLLAAEKTGRCCCGIEYEPKYVDVAIRRWQAITGSDAVLLHSSSGVDGADEEQVMTFDDRAADIREAQA